MPLSLVGGRPVAVDGAGLGLLHVAAEFFPGGRVQHVGVVVRFRCSCGRGGHGVRLHSLRRHAGNKK